MYKSDGEIESGSDSSLGSEYARFAYVNSSSDCGAPEIDFKAIREAYAKKKGI